MTGPLMTTYPPTTLTLVRDDVAEALAHAEALVAANKHPEAVAELGMKHGVGIVDHIEDRIVGLKVRDIYEVPAAAIILEQHLATP